MGGRLLRARPAGRRDDGDDRKQYPRYETADRQKPKGRHLDLRMKPEGSGVESERCAV